MKRWWLGWALLAAGCAAGENASGLMAMSAATRGGGVELPDCPTELEEPVGLSSDAWWVDVAVDTVSRIACAVDREGGSICWGVVGEVASFNQTAPLPPLEKVAVGSRFCGITKEEGDLVCWTSWDGETTSRAPDRGGRFVEAEAGWYDGFIVSDSYLDSTGTYYTGTAIKNPIMLELLSLKAVSSSFWPAGVQFDGRSYRDLLYPGPAVATDYMCETGDFERFHQSCHVDRAWRPFCELPVDPTDYHYEVGDVWQPSPCRWQDLWIEEDPNYRYEEKSHPTVIGLRFDGTVEVYRAGEVAGPPIETLIPPGQYVEIDGIPEEVGCGLTVEGEIRCWDMRGVLDQGVPDVP